MLRGAALWRCRRRRDAHGHAAVLPAQDARGPGRVVEERSALPRAALWHPERRGGGPLRLLLRQRQKETLDLHQAVCGHFPGRGWGYPPQTTLTRNPLRLLVTGHETPGFDFDDAQKIRVWGGYPQPRPHASRFLIRAPG